MNELIEYDKELDRYFEIKEDKRIFRDAIRMWFLSIITIVAILILLALICSPCIIYMILHNDELKRDGGFSSWVYLGCILLTCSNFIAFASIVFKKLGGSDE